MRNGCLVVTTTRNGNEDLYRTRLPASPFNPDWEGTSPPKSNPGQTQTKTRNDTDYVAAVSGKTSGGPTLTKIPGLK
jgi:hypothetical protein